MQILAIAIILSIVGVILYFALRNTTAKDVAVVGIGCPAVILQGISGIVMAICIAVFLISTVLLAFGVRSEELNYAFGGSLVVGIISFIVFGITMEIEDRL